MVDATTARDIERSVTAALARKGVGGTVVLRGEVLELHGPGPVVAIAVSDWIEQWKLLPPEMCDRRAELAADRLRRARQGSRPPPAHRPQYRAMIRKLVSVVLVLAVAAAVLWWLWDKGFFGRPGAGESTASTSALPTAETPEQGRARTARACEAARRRIHAGAAMGIDVAGWVVELWLARPRGKTLLGEDHALDRALAKLPAAVEPAGPSEAQLTASKVAELSADAIVVRLSGGYVGAFFQPRGREHLIGWSAEAASAAGAHLAAMSARCAHLRLHDVGAWYAGRGRANLFAALMIDAGLHAAPPAFDAGKLAAGSGLWAALQHQSARLDTKRWSEQLRRLGGRMVRPRAQSDTALWQLSFALGGPTRAVKASRQSARQLEL